MRAVRAPAERGSQAVNEPVVSARFQEKKSWDSVNSKRRASASAVCEAGKC